jgi:hypothetical protein
MSHLPTSNTANTEYKTYFLKIKIPEMKKLTLTGVLILLVVAGFSQLQCPSYFKRNNGICGNGVSTSEIQLYFDPACPTQGLPGIDSIYYEGARLAVTFMAPDDQYCKLHYINYCITSGNIPPANSLDIYLNYGDSAYGIPGGGQVLCTVIEGNPLPIMVNSFLARRSYDRVSIVWQSANENEVSGYEIQRSYDGLTFMSIATLACKNAAGDIAASYSYSDNNVAKSTSYYRIKVNSTKGFSSYTDLRAIEGMKAGAGVNFYPNPVYANSVITLSQSYAGGIVQIIDNSGRIAQSIYLTNSNSFKLGNLAQGLYFIKIINKESGVVCVQRMEVAR